MGESEPNLQRRMLLFLQLSLLAFPGFAHGWTFGQMKMIKGLGFSPAKLSAEAAEVSKMEKETCQGKECCKNCANCKYCKHCWWCDTFLGCGINENCKYCYHCQHCREDGFCGTDCNNTNDWVEDGFDNGFDCKEN